MWGNLERSLSLAPYTRIGTVRQGYLINNASNRYLIDLYPLGGKSRH